VYALLIGASSRNAVLEYSTCGLVLFTLYCTGVFSAMAVAFVLKKVVMRAAISRCCSSCGIPAARLSNLLLGLWERVRIFSAASARSSSR